MEVTIFSLRGSPAWVSLIPIWLTASPSSAPTCLSRFLGSSGPPTRLFNGISLTIRNTWLVNFNMNLQAFRPQLAGVFNMFVLAASRHPIRIVFNSSMGSIVNAHRDHLSVLETLLHNADAVDPEKCARRKSWKNISAMQSPPPRYDRHRHSAVPGRRRRTCGE